MDISEKTEKINQLRKEKYKINGQLESRKEALEEYIEVMLRRELPIEIDVDNDIGISVSDVSIMINIVDKRSFSTNVVSILEKSFGKGEIYPNDNDIDICFRFDK